MAFEIFHDDKVPLVFLADIVDRDDVGMGERARGFGFAVKPLDALALLRTGQCGGISNSLIATRRPMAGSTPS